MPKCGAMCEDDLNLLKSWQLNQNITVDLADTLTVGGWDELKSLAIRLKRSFPHLMEKDYDQEQFFFQYTAKQRAAGSYEGFVEGLFGVGAHDYIQTPKPTNNDSLLRVSLHRRWNTGK